MATPLCHPTGCPPALPAPAGDRPPWCAEQRRQRAPRPQGGQAPHPITLSYPTPDKNHPPAHDVAGTPRCRCARQRRGCPGSPHDHHFLAMVMVMVMGMVMRSSCFSSASVVPPFTPGPTLAAGDGRAERHALPGPVAGPP